MDVKGEVVVDAEQDVVWEALNDKETLKAATPGCKSLNEVEPSHYKADVSLGIAAVRGQYEADIKILDRIEPKQYRLVMNADSSMGFVEGDAVVSLAHEGGKTRIMYDGTAKVGGMIAGTGQRVLSGIAKLIVKDFFKKIAKEIKAEKNNK